MATTSEQGQDLMTAGQDKDKNPEDVEIDKESIRKKRWERSEYR